MNYLIDLILIAIIALFTFIGYKRGLIKVAFGLVSFILAIIISILAYKPISNFVINYTPLDDYIEATVSKRLDSPETTDQETENIVSTYYNNIKNASTAVISNGISKSIINVACMIIVFITVKIILLFFRFIGDLISKLPLIKQFNTAGGFIYGLLKGFIIIYVVLALITILSPIVNLNNIINLINSSIITNIMYNNNIIFILFA